MPEELRLVLLLLLGAVVGGQVNRAVDALGRTRRGINPWNSPLEKAPPRHWYDRLPVFGWFTVSREDKLHAKEHGRFYWVRPVGVELFCMAGAVGLYLWEIEGGLLPDMPGAQAMPAMLQSAVLVHLVLCPLMLAATLIDLDEMIIPDEITVPGTIMGLLLAALLPLSALPIVVDVDGVLQVDPLRAVSPEFPIVLVGGNDRPPAEWPAWMDGLGGLAVGLACWWGWYVVVVPKILWLRRGWKLAVKYMFGSIRKYGPARKITYAALAVTLGILGVWIYGGNAWRSLLSALIGMAVGSGMIWAVRIIGRAALKKEAMGFGDVTLMGMIGAFLGWQACIVAFFLAPFAGLALALPMKLIRNEGHIPYGPFLCLASLVTIVAWAPLWEDWARMPFGFGWMMPALLAGGLVCMGIMLGIWGMITRRGEA